VAPWNELVLACDLKTDVPQIAIDVLDFLVKPPSDTPTQAISPPDHHFFTFEAWPWLLDGRTNYFPGDSFALLRSDEKEPHTFRFTARTMVRGGEEMIAAFLHWLAPYCETQGFVGYTRCDETSDWIDLIYFDNGDAYYNSIALSDNPVNVKRKKLTEDGLFT
jgi:hypothetical protein